LVFFAIKKAKKKLEYKGKGCSIKENFIPGLKSIGIYEGNTKNMFYIFIKKYKPITKGSK
jgi:hypothetical protein